MRFAVSITSGGKLPPEAYTIEGEEDRDGCQFRFIDVESLEELLQFVQSYGRVVIHPSGEHYSLDERPYVMIEIYNDYRE
jgi:hypothetical protein